MRRLTIILLLALLALGLWLGWQLAQMQRTLQQSWNQVAQPVHSLSTQVAQVLHPTPTVLPDPVTVIHKVRSLARLETVQYSIEKVITAEVNQGSLGFLFGDRLLFVAHGVVIAGVDLGKLQPEDLQLRDGVLYLRLPAAEVFVATLDNDKSYVYDRETGLLTKGNLNLETEARRAAEEAIRQAALEDGILEQAQRNAEAFLERFLRSLGFSDIVFLTATPIPSPTP